MRILVYSDLQADEGSERCFSNPAKSLQLARVEQFYTDLFKIYEEQRCSGLIDLGDTFDSRSALTLPTLDTVLTGLQRFPNTVFNVRLTGNHDQFLRDGSVHNGKVFEMSFQVVSDCRVLLDVIEDVALVCCAYPESDAKLVDWLSETQYQFRNMPKVLLGHFQVAGCALQTGNALTGVPKTLLNKFELGLLGHIHKPQTLVGNVHYVGSPFQQNFGEAYEQKRVGIFDTKTLAVNWVELTGYPVYRTMSFSDFKNLEKGGLAPEDRFRLILRSPAESEQFFAHPTAARFEAVYDYKLSNEQTEAQNTQQSWTTSDVMRRYFKMAPPINIDLGEEEMLEYGRTIAQV